MTYPSKSVGKFHFALLLVNLAVSAALFVTTVLYFAQPELYWQYLTQLDWTVSAFHKSFFFLVHVSFLVWMFQVHRTIVRINPRYPVNAGGFVVRMLPFVQLWGIGSTFYQLGKFFSNQPSLSAMPSRMNVFIPLIYFLYYFSLATSPMAHSVERSSAILSSLTVFLLVAMYVVFLVAAYRINQCLHVCVKETPIIAGNDPVSARTYPFSPSFPILREQANIWIRLVAKVIDTALFMLITVAAVITGISLDAEDSAYWTIGLLALTWLGWIFYYALHISLSGQTFGKWLLRIRIVRYDTGENGGFAPNFLVRSFANYLIASFVPFYSLVDVCFIFSSDARCLHDRMAGTTVVNVTAQTVEKPVIAESRIMN